MELTPVWQQITKLLEAGVSLIPVRDQDITVNGKLRPKKSPCIDWKPYQQAIVTPTELWNFMEQHNTTAVAMVCGIISGNMEVIDVDVKWHPGIDATLFTDLKALYPDLLGRLRVHKTPTGGCHILYRTTQPVPGNQKLARRLATEAELEANPRDKTKCFLETRGEGGFVVAPPSIGYTIRKEAPIPVITWEERCSLISLCQAYNQVFAQEAPPKPTKPDQQYYDANPFEDYNQQVDAAELLQNCGWTYVRQSGKYLWFTKPGGRTGDVHGTFNTERRSYYIWTTGTDLDPRGYLPATLLAHYKFGGDKKACYRWLVQQGYGKIKPQVEAAIVQRHTITGKPLPANASPDAASALNSALSAATQKYPHGIFWQLNDKGKIEIDRLGLYQVAEGLGYRFHNGALVQLIGYTIHRPDERAFYDDLKAYIQEEDADTYNNIHNAYEAFIQKNGAFSIGRLALLPTELIIKDTKTHCYKFYTNGYLEITATGNTLLIYDLLPPRLIWADQVQPRAYVYNESSCKYTKFLDLCTGITPHLRRVLGYLCHHYKDETTGFIIVFTEQCSDPKQGGGSGKNIFANLLSGITTLKSIPGTQVQFNENFLQAWGYQRLLIFSDVDKKFNYLFLKDPSTGTGMLKKLFKNQEIIPCELMPKFIILTNYSFEITDGGLKRRIIPIEFTDFFTKAGGVDVHFGAHFPNDWTTEDWAGYDTFLAQCVQEWLFANLKLKPQPLSEGGWLKQFDQEYGQLTREFIEQHWEEYLKDKSIGNAAFNKLYQDFLIDNGASLNFKLTSLKMNKALKEWCASIEYELITNITIRTGPLLEKGRQFRGELPF